MPTKKIFKSKTAKKVQKGATRKKTQKIKSGVEGLDWLLDGGFPKGSVVLVSGSAGAGKTILSLQFIAQGAIKYGERGLYITLEQRREKIIEQAKEFGWDLESLEKKGMIKVVSIPLTSLGKIFTSLALHMNSFEPQRLVIDSITYLVLSAHSVNHLVELDRAETDEKIYGSSIEISTPIDWDGLVVRKIMVDLVKMLEEKNINALLTSEVSKSSEWYSRDTLSEFACDGIILLKETSIGNEMERTLEVVKMRNTRIKGGIFSFDFGRHGIEIEGT